MKFSNSLKFNAVPDWWDEYIAYSALKKQVYELAKSQSVQETTALDHGERTALMHNEATSSTDDVFRPLLDQELEKIVSFYIAQEKELFDEVEELTQLVNRKEEEGLGLATATYSSEDDSDDDDGGSGFGTLPSDGGTGPPPARSRKRSGSRSSKAVSQDTAAGGSKSANGRAGVTLQRSSTEDYDADLEASVMTLDGQAAGDYDAARKRRRTISLGTVLNPPKDGPGRLSQLFRTVSTVPETIWNAKGSYAQDNRMLFKRRITRLYISVTSLKSYVELNYSGFRKMLKKYDKMTYNELKDYYMHNVVEKAYPFLQSTQARVTDAISNLIALYAKCVTGGDTILAQKQLRLTQREQIVWERDTVWRQMIGKERRGETDGPPKGLGTLLQLEADPLIAVPTPVGRFRITGKRISRLIAIAVFVALLNIEVLDQVEANHCFAILVFATILWATEAIPLFVTSMFIPLLVVMLRVIRSSDGKETRLPTTGATKYIFSVMFSPTIMLLIGGFTISSALSKTNIDRVLITRVLSLAGTRPSTVLLAFMGVSCFASMWISNVAAPTLCFTLIRPILRNIPPKSSFAPCLILAIALAANIGGQSSPISSPQNLIALDAMEPPLDWLQWFTVSIPVSAVSLLLIWLLLLAVYRPARTADGSDLQIKPIRPTREKFTVKQWWVCFVCVVTIALWCVEHTIQDIVGDMGVIAIIPIVAFFGTGVLKKADFDQMAFSIVFLAMGGIALGKAVDSSGLLQIMGVMIRDSVQGLPMYEVVLVLGFVVMVIGTFISHTIAAVLLVPIAAEVGSNLPFPHPRLLIFITGLICSTGMGMPVSGFPNQTASTQEDEMGVLYLSNIDFLVSGVPASVIATLVVVTVGYLLMRAIGL